MKHAQREHAALLGHAAQQRTLVSVKNVQPDDFPVEEWPYIRCATHDNDTSIAGFLVLFRYSGE